MKLFNGCEVREEWYDSHGPYIEVVSPFDVSLPYEINHGGLPWWEHEAWTEWRVRRFLWRRRPYRVFVHRYRAWPRVCDMRRGRTAS